MTSRPALRGTKSNFNLNANVSSITDEGVVNFLKTEFNVRRWIEESLQIRFRGDFYEQLRNGIALCHLANSISHDAVPKIQENTKIEFKLLENLNFFLAALTEEFGIPRHKMFQVSDLYEYGNKVRVVECLLALSQVAEARGYPTVYKTIDPPKTAITMPRGEALTELKYYLAQIKEAKTVKVARKGAVILKTQMALLSGKNVDFAKCEKGFIAFQSLWRGFKARELLKKRKRDCAYRDKITHEIYKTEIDYVANLEICINEYMKPLTDKELLTKEQTKVIFSDIHVIRDFGQKLINQLKPRVENWNHHQKLGDIFFGISESFRVYTGYIQNYNNALEMLEEVKKKEKVGTTLAEMRASPACKTFDVTYFLIMPVQRVPRYSLLLSDLVKHTWTDHPDYKTLVDATERMKAVATFLNEKKREGENTKKFIEIMSSLEKAPPLFERTRKFIKEGVFTTPKKEEVSIFLFTDILVYGRPMHRMKIPIGASPTGPLKVKYKGQMELANTTVGETLSVPLQLTLHSTDNEVAFIVNSEKERLEWYNTLNNAIKEARDKAVDQSPCQRGCSISGSCRATAGHVNRTAAV
ncbi:hypothetical protein SAMD00019534_105840 [Acytostelium subglobosum LB1]|uniref:hypothetical protein n=1 Tax=Acytostelium subglobosum LB1 TaxID=1410327 RepID=UPI0006450F32|nr:hypothetical protein SAMD00019534_105840 [Acytostelium subglobosum LB1]GAM27408.1 hypothetical protein SAMD00019534_105840 [Acytostelium subglobosum LB1]|eukprot:XP_012749473.1 hypothetical protein SAMD00019534_105840 [Acytostelium subglobosum LB1]